MHVERYYYDGVRRIQEVWTDPIHSTEIEPGGGEGEVPGGEPLPQGEIEAANQELMGEAVGAPIGQPIGAQTWVNREYVYGPGTQFGIDEFVAQFDATNTPFYILQDASTDVAAITDGNGIVLEQYTWDPYGEALTVETFGTVLVNKVGHHGLFHDRLDVGIVQTSTSGSYVADTPQIVAQSQPNASNPTFSICYNRNRFYVPSLGRFANKDPNASGGPLMLSASIFGRMPSPEFNADFGSRYDSGWGLLSYCGASPTVAVDPEGLFMLCDLAMSTAKRGAMMGALMGGISGAMKGYRENPNNPLEGTIAGMFAGAAIGGVSGFVGGAVAGQLASMGGITAANCAFANSMTGFAVRLSSGTMGAMASSTTAYAMQHWNEDLDISALMQQVSDDGLNSLMFDAILGGFCFESETPIWTACGPIEIRYIKPGTALSSTDCVTTLNNRNPLRKDAVCIRMSCIAPDGTHFDADVLRPLELLKSVRLENGDELEAVYEGQQIHAKVLELDSSAKYEVQEFGRSVTGVFSSIHDDLLSISFAGKGNPLKVTSNHRLWSWSRNNWVCAKDLSSGEFVDGKNGPIVVIGLRRVFGLFRVRNLEVAGTHEFRVGSHGILAHNGCFGGSYGMVKAANKGCTPHHVPSNAGGLTTFSRGPCIAMDPLDHMKTASFRSYASAREYQQTQKALIAEGKWLEAFQMDIDDIRKLFGNKYDQHLYEARLYLQKLIDHK